MDEKRLCGARTRAGGTCKRLAMSNQARCDLHGAKSPQALRKAAERQAEAAARRTLAELGEDVQPVTDALSALEQLAGDVLALVDVLKGKVSELTSIRYSSSVGFEQTRAELSVYVSALGRAESVLGRIVALDLAGRRLRLDEARAMIIAAALSKVLAHPALELDAGRQARARALLAAELAPAAATVPAESHLSDV